MGKPQFRFRKFFACDLLTPQGVSGRNFVRGGICTLRCRNIFHIVLAVKVYKLDKFVVNFIDTDCDHDSDLDQQLAVGKR